MGTGFRPEIGSYHRNELAHSAMEMVSEDFLRAAQATRDDNELAPMASRYAEKLKGFYGENLDALHNSLNDLEANQTDKKSKQLIKFTIDILFRKV